MKYFFDEYEPSEQEHTLMALLGLLKKEILEFAAEYNGIQLSNYEYRTAVDSKAGLYAPDWFWPSGVTDGALTPEMVKAAWKGVERVKGVNWQDVDPYIDDFCGTFNEFITHIDESINLPFIVNMFATFGRENGSLKPIAEIRASSGEVKKLQDKYWDTGYYGRGLVQLTHAENYKAFESWLHENSYNYNPYSDPDVIVREPECGWLSALWYLFIHANSGGKFTAVKYFTENDIENVVKVVAGFSNSNHVLNCIEITTKLNEAITDEMSKIQITEATFGSINGKRTGSFLSGGYSGGNNIVAHPLPPINTVAGEAPNWPSIDIQKAVSIINSGGANQGSGPHIGNGKFVLYHGSRSKGQCAGGVARLVAYMSGVKYPDCNSYNATAAYNFMDGKLLQQGRFFPNGPVVPNMAGNWVCIGELKGVGRVPAGYTPLAGDIIATDTGRRDGHGFHLEIYLGKGQDGKPIGRSGWWSDFDLPSGPINYGKPSQIKRVFRRQ